MSIKMLDVAKQAGVSVATVSKYINGGKLREEYRKRVQKALLETDYCLNEAARNLKTKRSYQIGILIPSISGTFITSVISILQKYLLDNGYTALILDCQASEELEIRHVNVLLRWQVDGVIMFPGFNEKELLRKIKKNGIPVVLVDNLIPGIQCDAVVTNNRDSAYDLTQRVIEKGHTRIAMCTGPDDSYTATQRRLGYEQAMKEKGLTPTTECGFYTIQGGYAAVKKMMETQEPPTALIAANYHMTIGLLRALYELGISIPEDVSVVAFDEQEFDFALPTAITAVIQPMEDISKSAVEMILKRIEEKELEDTVEIRMEQTYLKLTASLKKIP